MCDRAMKDRIEFVIRLLYELKSTVSSFEQLNSTIGKHSGDFYSNLLNKSRCEVQQEIEKYKTNVKKITSLNHEITTRINEWYNFSKNPVYLKQISYPLKFFIEKRKLKIFIKHINLEVSELAIENRFIRERLTNWEHGLESKAVQLINEEEEHKHYIQLLRKKDELVTELGYLLPTVLDKQNMELDIHNLDYLIEELAKKTAA
ncbi:MAG: hypothetical protein N3I35_16225 [Clostridia bacterium]|nr:hypothetical protein [Clostridia bacterium]